VDKPVESLRIAIDASRTTVARITGTERYALELIQGIIRHNTSHEISLYFRNTPPDGLFPHSEQIKLKVIPFLRAWTHIRFAAELWHDRPDVTFVPAHTLPFLFPGKSLVTIHDLGYKLFPEAHPLKQRIYLDQTTRYSARRASLILTDSQATSDDLAKYYGTAPGKIRVIYPGVDAPAINNIDIRSKYGLPQQYFLFIGTLQPRKNIANIVKAYSKYRTLAENPVGLVLAGGKGWLYDESWVADVDGVYLPGYIDENDKGTLYSKALALIFPTLYEGFGFPVLESMLCKTPVIASNTSSLPELVGDAGLQVDPLNIDEIANAMCEMVANTDLRTDLVDRGYTQARKFTWDKAAKQTLAAFEEIGR
jgi:glycosyltransferase involved in cell wall biosynthesis